MSVASTPAQADVQPPAGLVARSSAALSTAWSLKHYLPTVARTAVSYYVWGPPQESWPLQLALFTALARYQSAATAAERKLRQTASSSSSSSTTPELDVVKATQATRRRVEKLLVGREPEQPKGGAVWEVAVGVKKRGLKGVLEEVDAQEDGTRTIKAEWTAHRSLFISPSSEPPKPSDRVILYTHGGAYTLLSVKTHRSLCVQLSKETGYRVLSLDYRLSPETRYPGAVLDAVNAYFYLTQDLGIPASNIIVGGDSAGGNLALALLLYLRDAGLPQLAGGLLISPWVDMTASLGSWDENKDLDYLSSGDPSDPLSPPRLFLPPDSYDTLIASPYVSPALSAPLHSLPPLLIHSGAVETLRDEHTLLAQRAARAGVDVTHEVFGSSVHVFHMIMKESSAEVGLKAIGEWATARREKETSVRPVEAEKLREVDERLRTAWEDRPAAEKAERAPSTLPAPRFTWDRVVERPPPIKLRENAHEVARQAVEENEREAERVPEGLTAVYYARPAQGVVGRVRGLLHL
ncbi:hypothetical protein JCM8097_000370 [Rhodosporidiobolus ruineniae]